MKKVIEGKNFSDDGEPDDYSDNRRHSTHVAGTMAATINRTGVVPEVSILILKVFDKDGFA
ncbi:S8 family serine peptidase (plasmid) [Bacillus paramycoides]|uniref:S8 family serine peptidase n=1 Tax=Bacillus paramycoides TaxID=2026194 RepID=UPI0031832142